MKKKTNTFIDDLILECEIDERIGNGVFDVYNVNHLALLVERIVELGVDEESAEDMIEKSFVDEGKYPDRQAYNKDGWLVTFPSKDYRDRAIKKGTHSISDPTHGKGGMNLYYKSKGKQKRQVSQAPTTTDVQTKANNPTPAKPVSRFSTQKPTTSPTDSQQQSQASDKDDDYVDFSAEDEELEKYIASKSGPEFKSKYKNNTGDVGGKEKTHAASSNQQVASVGSTKEPQTVSTQQVAVPPPYAELSKKFVAQKRWIPTEFGEYRDTQGNTVAVVGLSGEIVPIKNNDREEYKLFAEKNMPQP